MNTVPEEPSRVSLRKDDRPDGKSFLDAFLDDQGNLHLEGQDLGPMTAGVSDDGEYEYFLEMSATDLPRLLELLGAPSGGDVLAELASNWSGPASYELERMIDESGIPVKRLPGPKWGGSLRLLACCRPVSSRSLRTSVVMARMRPRRGSSRALTMSWSTWARSPGGYCFTGHARLPVPA